MTWIYNDNGFVLLQCQVHEVSGQDMSSIQGCLSLFTISGVACMVKLGWCESKGMKLNLEKCNQVHRDTFKKTWKNIYATSLYRLWCEAKHVTNVFAFQFITGQHIVTSSVEKRVYLLILRCTITRFPMAVI